jgi:hypothetical protein
MKIACRGVTQRVRASRTNIVMETVRYSSIWTRALVKSIVVSRGNDSEYKAIKSSRRSKATTASEDKARMIIASVCILPQVTASDRYELVFPRNPWVSGGHTDSSNPTASSDVDRYQTVTCKTPMFLKSSKGAENDSLDLSIVGNRLEASNAT